MTVFEPALVDVRLQEPAPPDSVMLQVAPVPSSTLTVPVGVPVPATVTSTAADAKLTVSDPATATAGKLVNGTHALAQPVQVKATSTKGTGGGAFASLASPVTLLTYAGPVGKDTVTIDFKQSIAETDDLRRGSYTKTLTFTLSTTTP